MARNFTCDVCENISHNLEAILACCTRQSGMTHLGDYIIIISILRNRRRLNNF